MKNKTNQPSVTENNPDQDEVARRAYELYEARGGEPGHDLDDWLHAEEAMNKENHIIRGEA